MNAWAVVGVLALYAAAFALLLYVPTSVRRLRAAPAMVQVNCLVTMAGLGVIGPVLAFVSLGRVAMVAAPGVALLGAELGLFSGLLEDWRRTVFRSMLRLDDEPGGERRPPHPPSRPD